jgi:glycosyltransferase involved in cell wall biosynthesis
LDLVFFGSVAWGYTFQRSQQLASRLAREARVLYVDPLGLRNPRLRDLGRLRAAASAAHPPEGLTILGRPLLASPFHDRLSDRRNARLLRDAIGLWGPRDAVFLLSLPSRPAMAAARSLGPRLLAYDCHDDYSLFHGGSPRIRADEERLVHEADLVFASAAAIAERLRAMGARPVLVPNAADVAHFSALGEPPADVAGLPRPRIGFVGEIGPWFDADAVASAARLRPDWAFVLVGPATGAPIGPLRSLPNVHLLGRRPYAALPGYLGAFDCCLLPFREGPLTEAVSPIKVYEYLASGRPVVSTPLPEVARLGDLVTIVPGPDLARGIEAALRDGGRAAERRRFARANTWDDRVRTILGALAGRPGSGA